MYNRVSEIIHTYMLDFCECPREPYEWALQKFLVSPIAQRIFFLELNTVLITRFRICWRFSCILERAGHLKHTGYVPRSGSRFRNDSQALVQQTIN